MANDRMGFVGASEAPAVLGKDSFCSPLKLYSIKAGIIEPDDLSDNEAVEWGTRLERLVSAKFAEEHNVKIMAYKKRYVHPDYPFISCELDNIITGTDELVEIKTVNAWAWKAWENPDELPEKVIIQVMTQLGLSKRKVGWVACLCGGQKYIEKKIDFDPDFYAMIVSKIVDFWKAVQDKTPPMAIAGDADLLIMTNPQTSQEIQAVESMNESIKYMQECKMHRDNYNKEIDNVKAKIIQVIGGNAGIQTSQYMAKMIEMKAQEYVVKKEATRQLRITKIKEAKHG